MKQVIYQNLSMSDDIDDDNLSSSHNLGKDAEIINNLIIQRY